MSFLFRVCHEDNTALSRERHTSVPSGVDDNGEVGNAGRKNTTVDVRRKETAHKVVRYQTRSRV